MKNHRVTVRSMLDKVERVIATLLTWVSFVLLLPSMVFSVYHTFVVFDLARVIAGLAVVVASVYVNKAL